MGLFKKKKVPEELPDLAIDEISKKNSLEEGPSEEKQIQEEKTKPDYKPLPRFNSSKENSSDESVSDFSGLDEEEKGFFKEIMENITKETEDIDKLDSWYKNKFLPEDIVSQMRQYWEKQSPEIILKSIGKELKDELLEKTGKLHQLEKEWQSIYFDLLAKEDEIRKEEKELKEALSELMNLFKKSLGDKDSKEKDKKEKKK